MEDALHTYDLYRDIQERCAGEIYIGVLGPVRCGKSTFIQRFMEEMVLPNMQDTPAKTRAIDELPQSGEGKMITTTEPKFVPSEAAEVQLAEDIPVKVRLIDCVGYLVEGAGGHLDGDQERMVKTPWAKDPIPFSKAARIGTDKVMSEHSTIGIMVTADGSFGEIPRENFEPVEKTVIEEMKKTGKPFLILLNSKRPLAEETKQLAKRISEEAGVKAIPVNCAQLKREDILKVLEEILLEFPVSGMEFFFPGWVELLPDGNPLREELIAKARTFLMNYQKMRDLTEHPVTMESERIRRCRMEKVGMADGCVRFEVEPCEGYFYEMLSETVGEPIGDSYDLFERLRNYSEMKQEYSKVEGAMENVRATGYGVVIPEREEIRLETPELIHQGNKFGVKIRAISPSIHMIRANIETEIAPIVGTKEQAEDLMHFISGDGEKRQAMWDTNIFGKSVQQLVNDGIHSKIAEIGPESQEKLQETMQKIVNDSNGGMVCIII